MPRTKADNRTRLLHAAEKVTYQYGFGPAAIADIAKEAGTSQESDSRALISPSPSRKRRWQLFPWT